MSKKSKAEERAAKAAAALAERKRKERRRNLLTIGGVVLAMVVIVAVGFLINQSRDEQADEGVAAASSTYEVSIGDEDAPHEIVIYEDFLCPICQGLEAATRDQLAQLADEGKVRVSYRPFNLFSQDGDPRKEYSVAAAAVFAVVLDTSGPEVAKEFHDLLYENQPSEAGPFPSEDDLVQLGGRGRRHRGRRPRGPGERRRCRLGRGGDRRRQRPRHQQHADDLPRRRGVPRRPDDGGAGRKSGCGGQLSAVARSGAVTDASSFSDFIRGLPKAELHVHHVGSASPRIVAELAERHPGTVPSDPEQLRAFYEFRDFAHFIEVYLAVVDLIRTPEDVRLLTYEVAREMAEGQSVRYAELTCTPYTSVRQRGADRGLHRGDRGRAGRGGA